MEKAKVWPVEKYARFVSSSADAGSTAKKTEGVWQHYSSREGGIQLALVECNHFMISSGTMIFESFSLWEAQKWLKIVTKGDSAMFIYRLKDENRRFRVKFSPSQSTTALEMCKEFAIVFTPLVPIREMGSSCVSTVAAMDTSTRDKAVSTRGMESDSQLLNYEDTQMLDSQVVSALCERPLSQREGLQQSDGSGSRSCDENVPLQPDEAKLIPVPDLGKLLQTQSKPLGRAYADTNLPTDQLGAFIRLCLTDANFPGFVDAVEKELNSMTGST